MKQTWSYESPSTSECDRPTRSTPLDLFVPLPIRGNNLITPAADQGPCCQFDAALHKNDSLARVVLLVKS